MSEIKDGGPAFGQVVELRCVRVDPEGATEYEPEVCLHGGLTMRDYFAAHADMRELIENDGYIPQRLALNVMDGVEPPNWENNHLAASQWWCEAEARVRYMKADAMLRARGQS